MAAADPRIRQIKIKTGVVKRIEKEYRMYQGEVVQQGEKVEKMKADNKDEYDIRKQKEVLEESQMMIPDTRRRLTTAHAELTNLLEAEAEISEAEEYQIAQTLLKSINLEELN